MRRRHNNRRRKNNQRKIIVFSLIGLLFIMVAGYSAFQTNLNINAKGTIKEKSRIIKSWTSSSNEDFHTDFYRENIVSATFLDSSAVPSNAVESFDVSADKKKGVMAWVVPSTEDNTKYDLFIGAKDGVIANENSSYLFYIFEGLKSIDFGNNFDTSNVTNMSFMFSSTNLSMIDVSDFNTSNVTSMSGMFSAWNSSSSGWGNRTLKEIIGLENFNTSNVNSMYDMFSGQPLTELNLTSFDTSKVTSMFHMFQGCSELTELNLCSFNTSNVVNMIGMFGLTGSLKKIKVGPNWTTGNADTTYMFSGSGVLSVTTGEC